MFGIRWPKSVSRKLLAACAKADPTFEAAILRATADVEQLLRREPEFVGESRDGVERLLVVKPLSVSYTIDYRQRIVYVVRVRIRYAKG